VPRLIRANAPSMRRAPVDEKSSYLITGGLGGLGLACAKWLVERGARRLWLVGRTPPDEAALRAIADLRAQAAEVTVVAADVADGRDMMRLMQAIAARGAPLKGVLHAAGVQASSPLTDIVPEEIRRVYRAKMEGAWTVHQATLNADLDFFVLFSSISATWGSKAQAHYAGANAFLDLLARMRRQSGLPAISIAWGPWRDVGMMEEAATAIMQRIGITALGSRENIAALDRLVGAGLGHATVAEVDWTKFRPVLELGGRRPFFDLLSPPETAAPETAATELAPTAHPLADIAHLPSDERLRRCLTEVQSLTSTILGLDASTPAEIDQGFFDMGFDSLMSLELKNRLEAATRVRLPATLVFDFPTIRTLAEFIAAGKMNGAHEPVVWRPESPVTPPPIPLVDDTGEDLDPSVTRRLERLEEFMRQG
jgi:NAD(P)-dependent dehydrogenase (short-subunit alcohol dehydrogenase family)/acyl carrier protein